MALVKFGSVITDSRGTIGGTSLKWSRQGNVMLRKPQPVKHATPAQTVIRAGFADLSKRWWSVLTPTQRTDWRELAAANPRPNLWGEEFPLAGLALYIAVNRALVQGGNLTTDDAPADQTYTTLSTVTLTVTAPSTASLAWTPTPAPTDHQLLVFASRKNSPGIANWDGSWRYIKASAIEATSPLTISSELLSLFGALTTGRQYAVRAKFLNTANGAFTPDLVTSAIAT